MYKIYRHLKNIWVIQRKEKLDTIYVAVNECRKAQNDMGFIPLKTKNNIFSTS